MFIVGNWKYEKMLFLTWCFCSKIIRIIASFPPACVLVTDQITSHLVGIYFFGLKYNLRLKKQSLCRFRHLVDSQVGSHMSCFDFYGHLITEKVQPWVFWVLIMLVITGISYACAKVCCGAFSDDFSHARFCCCHFVCVNVDVNILFLRVMTGRPPSSYGSMHSDDEEDEDDFEPPLKHAETKYSNIPLNHHKKTKSVLVSFYE